MRGRALLTFLALVLAAAAGLVLIQSRYGIVDLDDTVRENPGSGTATAASPRDDGTWAASPFSLRPSPVREPVEVKFAAKPRAGILFDVDSGEILWQKRPDRKLAIASLTKMMTAVVIARRHEPGERVAITREAVRYEGSGVGVLPKGKKVRLESLLNGLLLVSGNDAAIALAQHDAGTVNAFVRRMNRWRERLGLRCTRFSSPHGLEDRGNHSCARDLAALARAVLAEPRLRRIVGAEHARFPFPIKGGFHDLANNNPFLRTGLKGITGVKTGYTSAAGRCYVITARRGGRHLGVVLIDTPKPLDQVPALLRAGARRAPASGSKG